MTDIPTLKAQLRAREGFPATNVIKADELTALLDSHDEIEQKGKLLCCQLGSLLMYLAKNGQKLDISPWLKDNGFKCEHEKKYSEAMEVVEFYSHRNFYDNVHTAIIDKANIDQGRKARALIEKHSKK